MPFLIRHRCLYMAQISMSLSVIIPQITQYWRLSGCIFRRWVCICMERRCCLAVQLWGSWQRTSFRSWGQTWNQGSSAQYSKCCMETRTTRPGRLSGAEGRHGARGPQHSTANAVWRQLGQDVFQELRADIEPGVLSTVQQMLYGDKSN